MKVTKQYLIEIHQSGDAFIIPKPTSPGAKVTVNGKADILASVPGGMGWRSRQDEIGRFNGWITTDIYTVSKLAELDFVDASQVEHLLEGSRAVRKLSKSTQATMDVPENAAGYAPRPYQVSGVKFIMNRWDNGVGVLNIDEMGLGKTCQSLLASMLHGPGKMLIVCPANVKYSWLKEIQIWWGVKDGPISKKSVYSMSGYTTDGSLIDVVNGRRPPDPNARVVIVSYSNFSAGEKVANMLTRIEWDTIIIDEAHYIKNKSSNRSRFVRMLRGKKRLALTATPAEKSVKDAYPIVSWLDPVTFPHYASFLLMFPKGREGIMALNESLRSSIMIGRKKSEVAKELPPLMFDVKVLEPSDNVEIDPVIFNHGKEVQQMVEEANIRWATWLKERPNDQDTQEAIRKEFTQIMRRAGRIPGLKPDKISEMRIEAAMDKIEYVAEQVDALYKSGNKVIVGYHHKIVGQSIINSLSVPPEHIATIDGSVSSANRELIKEKLDAGEIMIVMASITAASTGINLQAAHNIVQAEVDWSGANNYQFAGRIHRIGQTEPCHVLIPVLKGTIEHHIMSVQAMKKEMIEILQD